MRKKIIESREKADAFLAEPFYIGLKVCALPDSSDHSDDHKEIGIGYFGGTKMCKTKLISSYRDLHTYCKDVHRFLVERDFLGSLLRDHDDNMNSLDEMIN